MVHAYWRLFVTDKIKPFAGQSLIEVTVALGALAVLFTVSATVVIQAIANAQEAKFQNQAGIYAQQGIEIARQMRDSDWSSFDSLSGVYCMAASCTKLSSSGSCGSRSGATCGTNIDMFSREVNLQRNDPSCSAGGNPATRVIVTVSWSDSKCTGGAFCRKASVETCFSNLYGGSSL